MYKIIERVYQRIIKQSFENSLDFLILLIINIPKISNKFNSLNFDSNI